MGERLYRSGDRTEADQEVDTTVPTVETTTDLDAVDKLLEEIDGILEANAEEFVRNYQQRGGE
jgi:ubiquitin-like protein Pup